MTPSPQANPATPLFASPRWRLRRLHGRDDWSLVLDADRWMEATGYNAAQVSTRLSRRADVNCADVMRQLRGDGISMLDVETSVLERVKLGLGYGAFAAACIHLLAEPRTEHSSGIRLDAQEILTAPHAVGTVDQDPNGSPFVVLARHGEMTEGLVLTWCHGWQAFRGLLRTSALCLGEDVFHRSLVNHREAVVKLMGSAAAVGAAEGSSSRCRN